MKSLSPWPTVIVGRTSTSGSGIRVAFPLNKLSRCARNLDRSRNRFSFAPPRADKLDVRCCAGTCRKCRAQRPDLSEGRPAETNRRNSPEIQLFASLFWRRRWLRVQAEDHDESDWQPGRTRKCFHT